MSKSKKIAHATKSETVSHETHAATAAPPAEASPPATPTTSTPSPQPALSDRVTQAVKALQLVVAMVAIAAKPLTARQVKVATKLPKGAEFAIPKLALMSTTYGVEVPTRPTADMTSNMQLADTLEPLLQATASFLAVLQSASFTARSEAWTTGTTLYVMLKKAQVRQPQIKAALAPVTEHFARSRKATAAAGGKKKAAQSAGTSVTPTTVPGKNGASSAPTASGAPTAS